MERFNSKYGECVCQESGHDEGQQHIHVVRQFEREDDAGKRGPHGAPRIAPMLTRGQKPAP